MKIDRILNSPNQELARNKYGIPHAIVMHVMSGTLDGCDSWFMNPESQVSAHFGIGLINGQTEIHQFVDVANTAYHAGGDANGTWDYLAKEGNFDRTKPNYYTIGIEMEGPPITAATLNKAVELVTYLCKECSIPVDREHIIGHYQINQVSRPDCPGINLDSFVAQVKLRYAELYPVKPPKPQIDLPTVSSEPIVTPTASQPVIDPIPVVVSVNQSFVARFITTLIKLVFKR